MNIRLSADYVKTRIRDLVNAHPDLVDDEQLRLDTIEGETDAIDLIRRIVRQIAENDALNEAVKGLIANYSERNKRREAQNVSLRAIIKDVMDEAMLAKLPLPEATVSVRTVPPKAVIDDASAIPDGLCRIKKEPDAAAIKSALESGEHVPGAHLSNGGATVSIRFS